MLQNLQSLASQHKGPVLFPYRGNARNMSVSQIQPLSSHNRLTSDLVKPCLSINSQECVNTKS